MPGTWAESCLSKASCEASCLWMRIESEMSRAVPRKPAKRPWASKRGTALRDTCMGPRGVSLTVVTRTKACCCFSKPKNVESGNMSPCAFSRGPSSNLVPRICWIGIWVMVSNESETHVHRNSASTSHIQSPEARAKSLMRSRSCLSISRWRRLSISALATSARLNISLMWSGVNWRG